MPRCSFNQAGLNLAVQVFVMRVKQVISDGIYGRLHLASHCGWLLLMQRHESRLLHLRYLRQSSHLLRHCGWLLLPRHCGRLLLLKRHASTFLLLLGHRSRFLLMKCGEYIYNLPWKQRQKVQHSKMPEFEVIGTIQMLFFFT